MIVVDASVLTNALDKSSLPGVSVAARDQLLADIDGAVEALLIINGVMPIQAQKSGHRLT